MISNTAREHLKQILSLIKKRQNLNTYHLSDYICLIGLFEWKFSLLQIERGISQPIKGIDGLTWYNEKEKFFSPELAFELLRLVPLNQDKNFTENLDKNPNPLDSGLERNALDFVLSFYEEESLMSLYRVVASTYPIMTHEKKIPMDLGKIAKDYLENQILFPGFE